MILLVGLLGCPKPVPDEAWVPLGEGASPAGIGRPTGGVQGGAWVDVRFPWSLRVPGGWEVRPGVEGDGPRATFVHEATGAHLEVWVAADELGPHPRTGCAWEFVDDAGYRALPRQPLRVATCTPADAREPRRLGYFFVEEGLAYDLEVLLPPGALLPGKDAGDALLAGFHLRAGTTAPR